MPVWDEGFSRWRPTEKIGFYTPEQALEADTLNAADIEVKLSYEGPCKCGRPRPMYSLMCWLCWGVKARYYEESSVES